VGIKVETISAASEVDQEGIPFPLKLLAFQGVLTQVEKKLRQLRGQDRIDKIKKAVSNLSAANLKLIIDPTPEAQELFHKTGNLLAEQAVVEGRLENLRRAQTTYDGLIYPLGMDSQLAGEQAKKVKLSVAENGELVVEDWNGTAA
jgi:hypothetical protein